MSNGGNYYALTLEADGASTAAFFSLTPTSNLQISQGGATLTPSAASSETIMVTIYPAMLQVTAPAGSLHAGVTIITKDQTITGSVEVSPPINVATVITLYGDGGQQLGQHIIDPAVGSGDFSFPVPATAAIQDPRTARNIIDHKIGTGKAAGPGTY